MFSIIMSSFLHRTSTESHNKCGQNGRKFMYTPTVHIFTTVTHNEPH